MVQTNVDTQKNENVTVVVGGIKNPRTLKPTGSFTITIYDVDGVSLIDSGYNINVAMTITGLIT